MMTCPSSSVFHSILVSSSYSDGDDSSIAPERTGRRILALPTVGTPRRRLPFQQGGAAVARQAHNLEVDGSNPSPASKFGARA